jgi:hypothetical protein
MKYSFFFDYIFYRVARAYRNLDDPSGIRGGIVTSSIKTSIVFEILLLLKYRFDLLTSLSGKQWGYACVSLFLVLLVIDLTKYQKRFLEFHERWKNEPSSTRIAKGFLVGLCALLPWLIVFLH